MLVVDASVIVTALVDDGPPGVAARARLRGERLIAPELLDVEVLSAIRGLERGGHASAGRAAAAVGDLADLPIQRNSHTALLRRMWELRWNVSSYDAAYVALAEAWEVPLLTADRRLATVPGAECTVEVLGA